MIGSIEVREPPRAIVRLSAVRMNWDLSLPATGTIAAPQINKPVPNFWRSLGVDARLLFSMPNLRLTDTPEVRKDVDIEQSVHRISPMMNLVLL